MSPILLIDPQAGGETPPALAANPPARYLNSATVFLLQLSHRLGAVALFAMIATWAMMYGIRDFHVPLAIAGGCADAGLCSALIVRMITRRDSAQRHEADGVAVFNLVLFVVALNMMIFARLERIRANASEFFTPTQQVAR